MKNIFGFSQEDGKNSSEEKIPITIRVDGIEKVKETIEQLDAVKTVSHVEDISGDKATIDVTDDATVISADVIVDGGADAMTMHNYNNKLHNHSMGEFVQSKKEIPTPLQDGTDVEVEIITTIEYEFEGENDPIFNN